MMTMGTMSYCNNWRSAIRLNALLWLGLGGGKHSINKQLKNYEGKLNSSLDSLNLWLLLFVGLMDRRKTVINGFSDWKWNICFHKKILLLLYDMHFHFDILIAQFPLILFKECIWTAIALVKARDLHFRGIELEMGSCSSSQTTCHRVEPT